MVKTRASLVKKQRARLDPRKGVGMGGAMDPKDYASGPKPRANMAKKRMSAAQAKAMSNKGVFGGGTLVVPKSKPASKPSMPDRKPKTKAAATKPQRTKQARASKKSSSKKSGGFDFASAIARGMGGNSAWAKEKKKAGVRD